MARKKAVSQPRQTPVRARSLVSGDLAADGEKPGPPFPIVGLGASAGGLEALTALLKALPDDTGMAFVVVQHLHPSHESILPEILSRSSAMPVLQVKNGVRVEPNRVYVIPPNQNMELADGALTLSPRPPIRTQNRAVDHFLHSLASVQKNRAIGVILSGTGTDGTLGLEEIKAEGGITFAQDATAEQNSMPRHAISAGCVDFVLPPHEIARELVRLARHPHLDGERPDALAAEREAELGEIMDLLRAETEVDFSNYKRNTLFRRISRRLALHKLDGLKEYIQLMRRTPAEVPALFQDILISVTSFFRNQEAFEALKEQVFPKLVEGRSRHDAVRFWVQGCSTGEEAYSLAIAFTEFAESVNRPVNLQVFATDLNGIGIEKARAGLYDKGIAGDVSPDRLRRFFIEVDGHYRIAKQIRDKCVFAQHNVLAAPPFSHIDLVSCRNLLIYLDQVAQQRLIPILHYALKPDGFLWLGASETIGSYRELFDLEDAKHKIYAKKPARGRQAGIPLAAYRPRPLGVPRDVAEGDRIPVPTVADTQREADRLLLAKYAPAAVLINGDLEILQFRGDTGLYLTPAPGKATLNLLKMLREGLLVPVRSAINKARTNEAPVRVEALKVRSNGGVREINVEVVPVLRSRSDSSFLVLFEPADQARVKAAPPPPPPPPPRRRTRAEKDAGERESSRLNQELAATREYLQSVIEQQEAANEELQSANEEVQSANEELQSINEELETSKEEIQSSNEELATVNDELQNRNLELSQTNNDFINLLSSVQMAIVMLGPDLRIRRFTPHAEKMLNLIASDVGRPITDIKLNISVEELEKKVIDVIDSVSVHEREVRDARGHWFSLRIRPYKTMENKIDGAVLVLVDVNNLKMAEQELRESETRFEALANGSPVLIWVRDLDGSGFFNKAYLDFLGVAEHQVQQYNWLSYVHPDDRLAYETAYRAALEKQEPFEFVFRFRRADGEYRWMKSTGNPRFSEGRFLGMAGSSTDITDLKEAEEALRQADATKDEYLLMLAHELRNPLGTLRNVSQMLRGASSTVPEQAVNMMNRQIHNMARTIDDLLEVSQLSQGQLKLNMTEVDLADIVQRAVEASQQPAKERGQRLALALPNDHGLMVKADAARLDQVFRNLITSASQYANPGGQIWISAQVSAGPATELQPELLQTSRGPRNHVVVRLRDQGAGTGPSILPRVLDPFSQFRGTAAPSGSSGVSLTLVRRMVELHGGSVEGASSGLGQGTEFVVRLPLLEDAVES